LLTSRGLALIAVLAVAPVAGAASGPATPGSTPAPGPCLTTAAQAALQKADLKAEFVTKNVQGATTFWRYKVTNVGCKKALGVKVEKVAVTAILQPAPHNHQTTTTQEALGDLAYGQFRAVTVACTTQGSQACFTSSIQASTPTAESTTGNNVATAP
jgi:hypothetical protein